MEFEGRGKELTNACYEETGILIVNDESEITEDERDFSKQCPQDHEREEY